MTNQIMEGYRKEFFESLDSTFEQGILISEKLSKGEDVSIYEWHALGLYLEVSSVMLSKLIKKEMRYREVKDNDIVGNDLLWDVDTNNYIEESWRDQ